MTSGHLLLGATSSHQAVELLCQFNERYPALTLSLMINDRDALISELREQRIDLAIHPSPLRSEYFDSIPLRVDPMVVCVSHDHSWVDLDAVTLR